MSMRILIVDDNLNNLRLLKDILEDEGYIVDTTDSSFTVLDLTHTLKPDLILLDIMMPGMDGYEVCGLLKRDFEIKDIPVIMVTAKTDGNDLKNAFALGAVDYIKKPIDENEVLARVDGALRTKQNQDQLRELATKDSLTGLYNHGLLIDLFEKELVKQVCNNENISFVMLDIDYFKRINDSYGHTTGDMVLREISSLLNKAVRCNDITARYGGEEFSIILVNTNLDETMQICERIRKTVEEHVFILDDLRISLTVSLGFYFKTPNDFRKLKDMIKLTDEALYQAKRNGRNRVEIVSV